MKRCFLLVLVVACLFPLPGRARGDDFADFRIPTHQVLSCTGSLDGWGRCSTSNIATTRARSDYLFGATGFRYEQLPLLTSSSDHRSSSRSTSERWEAGYSFGRYVGRAPIVVGADARALGDQLQSWNDSRDVSAQTDPVSSTELWGAMNNRRRLTNTIASLRPRVGPGRVRDATGVYTTRAIEKRLRSDGVLTQALSHEARQKLADLLTLSDAYDDLHARPAKGLWAEIERVLRDDGVLAPGGLDASSTGWSPIAGSCGGAWHSGATSGGTRKTGARGATTGVSRWPGR